METIDICALCSYVLEKGKTTYLRLYTFLSVTRKTLTILPSPSLSANHCLQVKVYSSTIGTTCRTILQCPYKSLLLHVYRAQYGVVFYVIYLLKRSHNRWYIVSSFQLRHNQAHQNLLDSIPYILPNYSLPTR